MKDSIKIELKSIVKSKWFLVMVILYILGIVEQMKMLFHNGAWVGGLLSYIKTVWLPLDFIMAPILFISYYTAKRKNDSIEDMKISNGKKLVSKYISILIVVSSIFLIQMLLGFYIAKISLVSKAYFLRLITFYCSEMVMFFVFTTMVGLYIGILTKNKKKKGFGISIIIAIFIALITLERSKFSILSLYTSNSFTSNFSIAEYNLTFILKNIMWVSGCSFIVASILGIIKDKKNYIIKLLSMVIVFGVIGITINNRSVKYDMDRKKERIESNESTYYANRYEKYSIEKYNMNIKFNDDIENECIMLVNGKDDDITNLTFGLFNKFKVNEVYVGNTEVKYEQDNNKLNIYLNNKLNKNEKIEVKIKYKGNPDVHWRQGDDVFFVNNDSIFLADVYEWYPKLNTEDEKEYVINVDYKSKNNLYSNLDIDGNGNYVGTDREIYFVSGNTKEKEYNGYKLIGNEEYFATYEQCEYIIREINEGKKYMKNADTVKEILFVPDMPGIDMIRYKKGLFFASSDTSELISTKLNYDMDERSIKAIYGGEF